MAGGGAERGKKRGRDVLLPTPRPLLEAKGGQVRFGTRVIRMAQVLLAVERRGSDGLLMSGANKHELESYLRESKGFHKAFTNNMHQGKYW